VVAMSLAFYLNAIFVDFQALIWKDGPIDGVGKTTREMVAPSCQLIFITKRKGILPLIQISWM